MDVNLLLDSNRMCACTRLQLDFSTSRWSVSSGQPTWTLIGARQEGSFDRTPAGELRLWEDFPRSQRVVICNAPSNESDIAKLQSDGTIGESVTAAGRGFSLRWRREVTMAAGLSPLRTRILKGWVNVDRLFAGWSL